MPQSPFDGFVLAARADTPAWMKGFLDSFYNADTLPGLIKDMRLVVVEGGPHAIAWTHASQVNTALLDFLRQ